MKKALLILLIMFLFVTLLLFLGQEKPKSITTKPTVMVSTFALHDIVSHLAGESVELKMLIPFGQDVHAFEPTPKSMVEISKSALFIYSGAGLEPWIKGKILASNALDISKHVKLHVLKKSDEHEDHDEHDVEENHHEHAHGDNEVDPHYWLDIGNMILSAQTIKAELLKLNIMDKDILEKNYTDYVSALEALKSKYIKQLKTCANPILVLTHNAFGYISARYNFEVESISGLSSDAMPSAKTMAHINDIVKEHNVSTLFYERFVSDKMVQSVSAQSGAKVDYLQSLANISALDAKNKKSYIDFMELNLAKMTDAMGCQ